MEVNINDIPVEVNEIPADFVHGAPVYGAPVLLFKTYEWIKDEKENDWVVKNIRCGGCNGVLSGFENYCPYCGGQIGETINPLPPQENNEDENETTN